jgi:heme-degrading monooxygenase HmoA
MALWTVDTWRVAPGNEGHFLEHCVALSPDRLILYRDLDEEGLFWSPAKWESLEALRTWRSSEQYASAIRLLSDDVIDHESHLMTDVPGLPPQESAADPTG